MKAIPKTIKDLPVGSRLLYRSKTEWRSAAIARQNAEKVTLTICSPTGRTYRLSRMQNTEISFEKNIPVLKTEHRDQWHENLTAYDRRW